MYYMLVSGQILLNKKRRCCASVIYNILHCVLSIVFLIFINRPRITKTHHTRSAAKRRRHEIDANTSQISKEPTWVTTTKTHLVIIYIIYVQDLFAIIVTLSLKWVENLSLLVNIISVCIRGTFIIHFLDCSLGQLLMCISRYIAYHLAWNELRICCYLWMYSKNFYYSFPWLFDLFLPLANFLCSSLCNHCYI